MFEYFNDQAVKVVMLAQEEARSLAQSSVGTEQILLGILRQERSLAARVLTQADATLEKVRQAVLDVLGKGSSPVPTEVPFTPKTKHTLEQALQEARQVGDRYVTPNHLLLSLTRDPSSAAAKVLRHLQIDPTEIRNHLLQTLDQAATVAAGKSPKRPARSMSERSKSTGALEAFGTSLTQLAVEGQLDPIVGRQTELERVIQILGRRTKNNPLLLGEPGVGKTAIAEGLAQRIVDQDVPEILFETQVIALDMASLVAGSRFRGDFEERLTQILKEVREDGHTIVVIDEIHTLIGGGAYEGSTDAANLMKPALARGELQCLGATTLDEYRKHIERDTALERRFQPVRVDEPSVEDTQEILRGLRHAYEQHHRVEITDMALDAAASLSERYISDRFLPDKAIDLIDEAGSRVNLRHYKPTAKKEIKQSLRQVIAQKQAAVKVQDFEQANQLREQELTLESELYALEATDDRLSRPTVTEEDIAQVLSNWVGIPVTRLTESESAMLLHLEDVLHERLIGQDEAVQAVARAMRRARSGLHDPQRPIASFIFSGPTGVGKTELSKALAAALFGSEEALIRLDMSEFMERHEVSKLIGSPPGFVGHEEGGLLTEAVRRRPYSVLLFDEIEKAHPDVYNLLLQLLDDGRLTDSKGRTVSFKNTVVIMTSNLGAQAIAKGGQGLGFDFSTTSLDERHYRQIRDRVMDDMKQFFRPEFINRVDDIIVFRQLKESEVAQIADLMLAAVAERLRDQQITLTVTEAFKDRVVLEGFDPRYGARPLRRAIMRLLEDPLADAILSGHVQAGGAALVDLDDDGQVMIRGEESVPALVP